MSMKKSKKFIKFKDYIIKLPNSMGLTGHRNNEHSPFVEQPPSNRVVSDIEGPDAAPANVNESFGFNPFQ